MHYQISKASNGLWNIWAKPLAEQREGHWMKHSQHKTLKQAKTYASVLAGWSGKVEIIK
jgi:hypothetical protein